MPSAIIISIDLLIKRENISAETLLLRGRLSLCLNLDTYGLSKSARLKWKNERNGLIRQMLLAYE